MLSVVSRDVDRSVVRSGPNEAFSNSRLPDRVQRAVELLAGHVARNRLAARALEASIVRRQVGADPLPGHAAVAGAEEILGAEVEHVGVMRRRRHRWRSRNAILEVARLDPVERLDADVVGRAIPGAETN